MFSKSFARTSLACFLFSLLFLTAGCSDDESQITVNREDLPERELSIHVYPGVGEDGSVIPRLTVVDGNKMCNEFYDSTRADIIVYHYRNIALC